MAGNFNTDLIDPEGKLRDENIVVALVTTYLEDMGAHFLPQYKPWTRYGRTWIILCRFR